MSETCSTCKYFGKRAAGGGVLVQNEIDGWTSSMTTHNLCHAIKDAGDYSGDVKSASTALAILSEEPGQVARLRVLPTFGCVLHETK